jgi:hypothetical protein
MSNRRHQIISLIHRTSTRCLQLSAILFMGFTLSASRACAQVQSAVVSGSTDSAMVGAPGTDALLLARKSVEKFFEQSSNVVCTESVSQLTIGKNGKPDYREESRFVYQLQASTNSGSLKLNESRETRKAAFRDAARTLLITNGFASMLLIVHPSYEASYTFEPAGEESVDGKTFVKIGFKPVPGGSSPAAMQLRGQNYPLPLFGTLWIDPQNGAITKLIAAVDSSLSDLGLQGMRSEIHYANVQFHDPEETYWMPVSATIDVETPRQHWRNVHRFTAYKRFTATIRIEDLGGKP